MMYEITYASYLLGEVGFTEVDISLLWDLCAASPHA
jgi:hypothetical protein